MKQKIIKIISWITFIISISGLMYLIYLQFANPDMTRTRFFLTYWKEYLYCIIPLLISKTTIDYISRKELNESFKSLMNSNKKGRKL